MCLNRPGNNYVCACPMGYELAADYRSCVVPEAFIMFARRQEIKRISLQSKHMDIIPVGGGIESIAAFDYSMSDNRIYWVDSKQKSVHRAFMNGSAPEHIIEFGVDLPEGVAVDWIASNVYWTDFGHSRIEVARVDGSARKVLVWKDLLQPRSIALNPGDGTMYWADWGKAKIERAGLDGSKRSIVLDQCGRANGLTIDYIDRRLYWVNTGKEGVFKEVFQA